MLTIPTDDGLAFCMLGMAVVWASAFLVYGHYERKRVMEQSKADLERWKSLVPRAVQEGTIPPVGLHPDDWED